MLFLFTFRFERRISVRSVPRRKAKRGHPTGDRKKFIDAWSKGKRMGKDIAAGKGKQAVYM